MTLRARLYRLFSGNRKKGLSPTQIIAITFAAIIVAGALLLMLPIASRSGESCGVLPGDRLDLAFCTHINEFRGNRTVQLQLCDLHPAPDRAQLEQELFQRLRTGQTLSRWEAGLMLPERHDFAHIWRFLERSCAAGPLESSLEHLLRQMTRGQNGRCSCGKALVCLQVMDDRGLIRVKLSGHTARVEMRPTQGKVDLEQAQLMQLLRAWSKDL